MLREIYAPEQQLVGQMFMVRLSPPQVPGRDVRCIGTLARHLALPTVTPSEYPSSQAVQGSCTDLPQCCEAAAAVGLTFLGEKGPVEAGKQDTCILSHLGGRSESVGLELGSWEPGCPSSSPALRGNGVWRFEAEYGSLNS